MMMMRRSHHHQPPCDRHADDHHYSRLLHDLSTLVLNLLRSPLPFPDDTPSSLRRTPSLTPAGLASLMLGMSLSLMLCGSLTFFIGFLLMPWVLFLLVFLYLAGIVSALSFLARSLLCFSTGPPAPKKDIIPSWKLL